MTTYLYLYRMNDPTTGEEFHKVGISKDPSKRFKFGSTKVTESDLPIDEMFRRVMAGEKFISEHPYETELLKSVAFRFEGEALWREQALLNMLVKRKYVPNKRFSGDSECFNGLDDAALRGMMKFMDGLAENSKKNEPGELEYAVEAYLVKELDPLKKHLEIMSRIKQKKASQ